MNIQKIKELALANGFKLKEQASGNMDLNSYVYDFANAIEQQVLAQARIVFGQDGVTTFDTETLDSEIDLISDSMSEKHFFDNDESYELELLVAKSMKLGELYERKKWQAAKAKAVPDGFVLMPTTPSCEMWSGIARDLGRYMQMHDRYCPKTLKKYFDRFIGEIPEWLNKEVKDWDSDHAFATADLPAFIYMSMVEAQEPAND